LYQKSTDGAWSEVDVIRDGTGSPYDALGFSVAVSSIDGLSDYWVVSGAPQILANGTGELRATGNIASLIDTDSDATKNDSDTDHDNNKVLNVNDRFPHDPAALAISIMTVLAMVMAFRTCKKYRFLAPVLTH
jgi:hypothetical protein